MKKVGIYINSLLKKNKGGPSGYLYNLKEGLEREGINIKIYSKKEIDNIKKRVNSKSSKIKGKNIYNILYLEIRLIMYYLFLGNKIKKSIDSEIFLLDVLHIHSCEEVYAFRKRVKFNGKIILTPHRPEPFYSEVITTQQITYETSYSFPLLKKVLIGIEKKAYKYADGFIFPSQNAKNIYLDFPGFKYHSKNKPINFVYSGVPDLSNKVQKGKYKIEKLKLSNDQKMISFIGRHNYIKGYDLLVNNSRFFFENNINVVCAGATSSIKQPISNMWNELGYINDAYNLIYDSDLVIIPNRNTYFDLVILEVLSLGTVLITSDTGGNIDIAKETTGVILFENGNIDSLNEQISRFYSLTEEEKKLMKKSNRNFYEKFCTVEKFAENYNNVINSFDFIN